MSWKYVQRDEDGKYRTTSSGGGGASALTDLDDVDTTGVSDGDLLGYDSNSNKWIPHTPSSGHTYSTTEQVIGTWIDGKPLYEKTINVPISSITGNETTINHDIANIDTIYFADGCMLRGGNLTIPLVTYHTASSWAASIYNMTRTSFVLYLGGDERSRVTNIYVTLRYTKTTD